MMRTRWGTLLGLVAVAALVAAACGSKPGSKNINTPPTALISAAPLSGPAPLTVDFSGLLSSDAGGEIVAYDWDLGEGTTSDQVDVSHTYTVEGIYDVVLSVTDNKDGVGTDTVQVVVNTDPTVTAGSDATSGATPLAVNFTSTSNDVGGSIVSTEWDFGDGATSTDANPTHTYLAAGSYDATVKVTDNLGGIASDSVPMTVTGNAGPVASASSDVTSGKTALTVTFDGSGSTDADDGIASWYWDFGDGDNATGATPAAHTYATAGTYSATLTVTDVLGATDTDTVVISVVDNVAPVSAPALATAHPKPGLVVSFDGSASTDSDGTIVSYDWVFGDGNAGTGVSPTHTYAATGSYPANLTVTDDNGAKHVETVLVQVANNVDPVSVASSDLTSGVAPLEIAFEGTGSSDSDGSIVSYSWDFGDTNTSTDASPTHTYAAAGNYTATLTVTDDNSATAVDTIAITVDP
ncbi:MAG: PKD domain-containing protein [Actinomycetia bacterium]|nr:PKD domain-containing protein [Actinomycetes bacterium]